MSQDTENTPDTGAAPDPTPEGTTEKAKKPRRTGDVQIWQRQNDGAYRPINVPDDDLANLAAAEKWVAEKGEPAERYAVLRLVGVYRPRRSIEEVPA